MTAGSPQVLAAALIRADIRKAAAGGALGEIPAGISLSVSANNLRTAPGVTITVYGARAYRADGRTVNEAGAALRAELLKIAGRHWQPAPGGFTDVQFTGLEPPDEETTGITGPPAAHGDISGRPRRVSGG
jgi:hypothetical protein